MAKPRRQQSLLECSKWTEEDSAEENESVALAKTFRRLRGLGYQLTFPFHVERETFTWKPESIGSATRAHLGNISMKFSKLRTD